MPDNLRDCVNDRAASITVVGNHGLQAGDIIQMQTGSSRLQRIKRLLVRPRIDVVTDVTATTASIEERRPTWREWWLVLRGVFK